VTENPHDNLQGKHLFSVGTYEHEILDALCPHAGELVLNKNSSSVFNSTGTRLGPAPPPCDKK
jgi:hypothetical protein